MLRPETKQSIDESVTATSGWVQRMLQSRVGLWMVAAVSFFESSLPVPIITDPFMVAGIMANRSRAHVVIAVTIVSSILGGIAAFATALLFADMVMGSVANYIGEDVSLTDVFTHTDAFITTLTGAITPIPYTIVAWVVAILGGNMFVFLVGSIIGRTIRYAVVGYTTYKIGPAALQYARRSLWLTSVVLFLLVGLYVFLKTVY